MKIFWNKTAIKNLDEIIFYISTYNKEIATHFIQEILEKIKLLSKYPNLGKESMVMLYTREFIVNKNYLITYRVWSNHIEILQIWHTKYNRENK